LTAQFAAEQGREIFAVPGSPLDPRAEGTNDLLRDGASFCTKAEDVLEALARRDLSRDPLPLGFSESSEPAEMAEPLWDELDLAEAGATPFAAPLPDPKANVPSSVEDKSVPSPSLPPEPAGARPNERSLAELTLLVTELLGPTPVSVDELVRTSRAQAREVRVVLFELERAGKLEWHGADLVSLVA
jgi:DNA processing protein